MVLPPRPTEGEKSRNNKTVMSIALLTIGTELTRGDLHNTNSGWLAERLTSLGYEVTHMLSVDDDDERICQAFRDLSATHELVISTGGLGPTTDDRTTACVARVMNVKLVRNELALAAISALFKAYGKPMSPSNAKQADLPDHATLLPNTKGTAPGFMAEMAAARVFVLPGVPREMMTMFDEQVVSLLPLRKQPFTTVRLRSFGIAEAEVNDRLAGLEEKYGITIGYRASPSDLEIKVQAQALDRENEEQLEARAHEAANEIAQLLGLAVYSRSAAQLPDVIAKLLIPSKLTLALAESCTGGLVSEWLTRTPGASRYYKGGVVSYANTAKAKVLGVPETVLHRHGAVSEPVARAMAEGAKRIFGTDYAVSITGIAGPDGGSKEKPVGLIHWAVAGPQGTIARSRVMLGDRGQIQRRAAMSALFSLYKRLIAPAEDGV